MQRWKSPEGRQTPLPQLTPAKQNPPDAARHWPELHTPLAQSDAMVHDAHTPFLQKRVKQSDPEVQVPPAFLPQ